MTEMVCRRPPEGWYCTREPDHEGPCAAWPVEPMSSPLTNGTPRLLHWILIASYLFVAISVGYSVHDLRERVVKLETSIKSN